MFVCVCVCVWEKRRMCYEGFTGGFSIVLLFTWSPKNNKTTWHPQDLFTIMRKNLVLHPFFFGWVGHLGGQRVRQTSFVPQYLLSILRIDMTTWFMKSDLHRACRDSVWFAVLAQHVLAQYYTPYWSVSVTVISPVIYYLLLVLLLELKNVIFFKKLQL